MKWARNRDYHGSRSYDMDQPVISRFSLLVAWMTNIASQKFARRSAAAIPLFEGQFAALGADDRGAADRERPVTLHDRRDSRVLP